MQRVLFTGASVVEAIAGQHDIEEKLDVHDALRAGDPAVDLGATADQMLRAIQLDLSRRDAAGAPGLNAAALADDVHALLADLGPGDEVVMPSYTFSSTANAVVLRGATPMFVDVRADTLNIDAAQIRPA